MNLISKFLAAFLNIFLTISCGNGILEVKYTPTEKEAEIELDVPSEAPRKSKEEALLNDAPEGEPDKEINDSAQTISVNCQKSLSLSEKAKAYQSTLSIFDTSAVSDEFRRVFTPLLKNRARINVLKTDEALTLACDGDESALNPKFKGNPVCNEIEEIYFNSDTTHSEVSNLKGDVFKSVLEASKLFLEEATQFTQECQ